MIQLIEKLRAILASDTKMLSIIQDEVRRLRDKYGDDRRTQIVAEEGDLNYEDTIEQKDMVITISHAGYIKRQEISAYRAQRRGGKGVIGARTKEDDFIEHLFIANTHAYLLILTDKGRCYWLKVHEIEAGNTHTPRSGPCWRPPCKVTLIVRSNCSRCSTR